MIKLTDLTKAEWQKKVCTGCQFAEPEREKAGKPWCTYPGSVVYDVLGHCKSRKEG